MSLVINKPKDALAGIFFILLGSFGGWIAMGYPLGSSMRMGAGYFPLLVSSLLALLGLAILLRSAAFRPQNSVEPLTGLLSLRPTLLICAGVSVFALLVPSLGLVLTTIIMTMITGYAQKEVRLGERVCLSLFLAGSSLMIFVYGLGLQLSAWPS
jgi:uncharacterized membrane protein